MAENESLTPEKQLLKLIENPGQTEVKTQSIKREGKKWFSISVLKGRLAFWKNRSGVKKPPGNKLSKNSEVIRKIGLALKILLVFGVVYTVYSVWDMAVGVQKASNLILAPDKTSAPAAEPVFSLPNIAYYLERVKGRNVFSSPQQLKKQEVPEVKPEVGPEVQQAVQKDWSLVGIAWSDDPEAMIEDQKTGRTLFVRRGQTAQNGVQVVAIFKDKVILNCDGREIELR